MRDQHQLSYPKHLPPGTRLNDIYEIDALLASGGMGDVYRGRATETGDLVAIKTIRPELAGNEAVLGLFRREAAALHQIHHEAVVRYFVFSMDRALNLAYLAMEFVQGESISQRLRSGPFSLDQSVTLMRRVASGLKAAHDKGIVHRDISPDNIIVPDGDPSRARIVDFGIARSMLDDKTIIGTAVAGKFAYMSPEQLGLFGGHVSAKSDIYSLGLVVAQCLLGKPLNMVGSHAEITEKRRTVPDLTGIDPLIAPLLRWMLQPDPKGRPADMQAILDWEFSAPDPTGRRVPRERASSRRGGETQMRKVPPTKRRILPWTAAALTFVILLGGGYAGYKAWIEKPSNPGLAFIQAYPAKPCFALLPASSGPREMKIDGYGHNIEDFEVFDAAFKESLGFEAEIELRQITREQCGVATFLGTLKQSAAAQPGLVIDKFRLRDGEVLSGTRTPRQSWSALLHVGEDGTLTDVTSHRAPQNSPDNFSVPVKRSWKGAGLPQLLLAIDSTVPLDTVEALRLAAARADTMQAVLAEATEKRATVTANLIYFKVD